MYKEIKGLEGRYSVDENGNVFSHHRGIKLKPGLTSRRYLDVNLAGKRRQVHRLVAEAFLPDFLDKPQVNHKDGNKQNNHISNLEMATSSENMLHAYKTGLNRKGENHPNAKLSNEDVATIKMLLCEGERGVLIAKKFGVVKSVIYGIKSGRTRK